jgi:hypothetical protein
MVCFWSLEAWDAGPAGRTTGVVSGVDVSRRLLVGGRGWGKAGS